MAKRKVKREPTLTRKQISRRQREERQRRLILLGAGAVLLLVLGILGFGYYETRFLKPASPVAVVNGVPLRTDEYQKMVIFQRFTLDQYRRNLEGQLSQLDNSDETEAWIANLFQQELAQIELQRAQIPSQTLEIMIEDELTRQGAQERGITVTEEEIDRAIEESYGYQREPVTPTITATEPITPTPTITATEPTTPTPTLPPITKEQFEQAYQQNLAALAKVVILERFYRDMVVWRDLLRSKMQEVIGQEVPTSEEQVHVRRIVLETKEEAEAARERLVAGEDFATLADEINDNIDDYADRNADMRKSLKEVVEAQAEWQAQLKQLSRP
ncbi:MAG: SurA N-terminal domain-containing protein, partial [Anaerolineae bacterium]|nr:SurA N-terminal domain-containing protein [Anaerolineae bacterium]